MKRKLTLKVLRLLFNLLSWFLWLGVLGVLAGVGVFYYFGSGLPNYQQLAHYKPPVTTRFYANDGRLFGEYAFEKRLYVPLSAIPPQVIHGFLAAEDKNFYSHLGVDPLSILSAAITNISRIQESKRPIGASTITQQVARNFLLQDISTLVSLDRKIKEAILAFRIEQAYSKDYILELYLNQIYLGSGAYGVAAAALTYFNKSLDELTLEECAFLAGLPKAPSHYDPRKAYEAAKGRRNYVIKRMEEEGFITTDSAQKAMASPLETRKRHAGQTVKADFFAEEVRRELLEKFGEKVLYTEGLTVRSTLDPKLQTLAETSLRQGLIDYDRRHGWRGPVIHKDLADQSWQEALKSVIPPSGKTPWLLAIVTGLDPKKATLGLENSQTGFLPTAEIAWARPYLSADSKGPSPQKPADILKIGDVILVSSLNTDHKTYSLQQIPKISGALIAMDPHTGGVLAMQGGYSFDISQFNRATQAKRQTGSAFKTFVYLTALERGLTPSTIIDDAPLSIDLGYGLGIWRPRNYDGKFKGPITLRRAFELSRNLVTVRIAQQKIGMKYIVETAKRFRIVDHMPMQLAMVLGAGESTLIKMTAAHAMIANGGKDVNPTFIERAQDRQGKTLLLNQQTICDDNVTSLHLPPTLTDVRKQITDPVTAYQMISLQEGVIARGTGRALKVLNRPLGGKSGTTNDFKDAWFIASSPHLVVGVVIFFDHPTYMGKDESGGRLAAPIARDFIKEALDGTPAVPFPAPAGIKFVKVNVMSGRTTSSSQDAILEVFRSGTEDIVQTSNPYMTDQDPQHSNEPESTVNPSYTPPLLPPDPKTLEAPAPALDGLY